LRRGGELLRCEFASVGDVAFDEKFRHFYSFTVRSLGARFLCCFRWIKTHSSECWICHGVVKRLSDCDALPESIYIVISIAVDCM
jgi:hypothetical protein